MADPLSMGRKLSACRTMAYNSKNEQAFLRDYVENITAALFIFAAPPLYFTNMDINQVVKWQLPKSPRGTRPRIYRVGRPICRKVLKIMFWDVPPADWLLL